MIGRILFWILWPALWFVMPMTRRVRVIIIVDQKVLLVRGWISDGSWELPGGGLKFKESIDDAARRELQEELGLHLVDITHLHDGEAVFTKTGLLHRMHYVQATIKPDEVIAKNWEIAEFAWQPLTDVLNSDMLPELIRESLSGRGISDSDTL